MTQAISPSQIPDFLAKTPPFDRLAPDKRKSLGAKCQLLRYRIGQRLFERDKMPNQIAIIYDGQVRVLGYDQRSQSQVSLKRVGSGEILGWASLVRGMSSETAIASTEVTCITLASGDFLALLEKEPPLQRYFQEHASPIEIFELLSLELERRADRESDLRELSLNLTEKSRIVTLQPNTRVSSTDLDRDFVWMVSSGQLQDIPAGSRVEFNNNSSIAVEGNKGARLLGVPAQEIYQESQSIEKESVEVLPPQSEQQDQEEIPYGPEAPQEAEPDPLAPAPKYPFFRGQGSVDAAMACFKMLSRYLGLSFRRDPIRKFLVNQVKQKGEVTLYDCGAVGQSLGLQVQLAQVPKRSLKRLKGPAMIAWEGSFALLYKMSEKEIVMAVPEQGVMHKSPDEITDTWEETGQILLLHEPAANRQEKFGFWWFLPSLMQHRRVLIEVFITSFFIQLFGLATPLGFFLIIQKVIGQRNTEILEVIVIFLLGVALLEAILTGLRSYTFVDTTNRIDLNLGSQVIDHLFRLPLSYFDKRQVGETAGRMNELGNIRQFLTGTALTVVLNAVFSILYIVILVAISPLLTAVVLAVVPLFALQILITSPVVRRMLRRRAERYSEAQSYLVESIGGIQSVKAQNLELTARWNWYERYARYMNASFKTALTQSTASSISSFLNKVSMLLLLWFGAYLVINDDGFTLGHFIAFRIISNNVIQSLVSFVQVWQNFQEVGMSVERLQDILNAEPEADDQSMQNIPMPDVEGSVAFNEVSFRFHEGGPLVLTNLNVSFDKGTFIGIVGQSGSGKSTLMKLLQRLYEPSSGYIQVDGYDINKVELYSLRRQIGVVLQDTLLFNGTVRDNIALSNPEASDDEIIAAAKVAAAHEFIMGLSQGYNSPVGERGANLSGGQRQRIAIARVVLQRPRLIILDEATSALDYNTERLVSQNLQEEFKGRTVFFITHRLPTVKNADTILVMDQGSLVEQGTHEELMGLKGRYYCLYQQQESQL
jgi:ATP-binding cassette subfamily B protein